MLEKKLVNLTHSQLQKHSHILFKNITLVSPEVNFEKAYLEINNGKIVHFAAGEWHNDSKTETALVVDATDFLVCPSFINAHSHVAMSLFRDLAHDQSSMIYKLFFPWEKNLDANIITALCYPYILNGLLTGTSTFADHYYFEESIVKAMQNFGVKGLIGETIADINGPFMQKERWHQQKTLIENWSHDLNQFVPVVAPHATDSTSRDLLTDMAQFAKDHQLPLHMHMSQTAIERKFCEKNYNMSPVQFADSCGALGPHSIAVHLVSADENDLEIIKNTQTFFGFTPGSEIIYEHLPLLSKILKLNIPFVLGTDCAAANDQADMISEMKLTHLLCQDRGFKNLQLSEKILNSCTHQAAQAYGVDNWSTLKVGACADLNFFAKTLSTLPLQKPLENLIFSHSGQTLKHVMINGEWILYNQTPTKIDLECAKKDFTEALKIFRERIH